MYDNIFEHVVDWFMLCMTLYTGRLNKIWPMNKGTCISLKRLKGGIQYHLIHTN